MLAKGGKGPRCHLGHPGLGQVEWCLTGLCSWESTDSKFTLPLKVQLPWCQMLELSGQLPYSHVTLELLNSFWMLSPLIVAGTPSKEKGIFPETWSHVNTCTKFLFTL